MTKRRFGRWVRGCGLAVLGGLTACASGPKHPAHSPTEAAREDGPKSNDGEVVGRWLLAEMLAPGGTSEGAAKARARLDKVGHKGMIGSLAAALDDTGHGRLTPAADEFFSSLDAARESTDSLAPMVAWVATNHLGTLSSSVPEMFTQRRAHLDEILQRPGAIGWRARGELVDLWASAVQRAGEGDVLARATQRYGCMTDVRVAGPFGRQAASDKRRSFAAERPGPWPARWEPEPGDVQAARVLGTEREGCLVHANEPVRPGVFYSESYVEAPQGREVIVAVQGSVALWVDDRQVLTRDTRVWGVWPKFGVKLRIGAGRHRVVARLLEPETSVRVLGVDGAPSDVRAVARGDGTYSSVAPVVIDEPNVLVRYVDGGRAKPPRDEIEAFLASFVAGLEGQYDVASVLIEPLLGDRSTATALTLSSAAGYAEKDPIFPEADARDVARLLREQAARRDPKLWWPRLWLMANANDKDPAQLARGLQALADEFPGVAEIGRVLVTFYGRLGWRAERVAVARALVERSPDDRAALETAVAVEEETGHLQSADAHAARLRQLYPDSEIVLDRALARHDYAAAEIELRRVAVRHPERKDVLLRLDQLLTRAGKERDPLPALERALKRSPREPALRLEIADARFAAGDRSALRTALAASIQQGVPPAELRAAIELVEGMTELEPYRIDGRAVVRAYETSGTKMEGTAARVLDYSALWVHADGSARMLEHELIRVQSQEAIGKLAEQSVQRGAIALTLRVIKKGGAVLEPERVEGKPTVTMPHLEVGDYIETETVTSTPGDGEGGKRYLGPHWFFREADIAYWRSEFIVIAPKDRPLVVETTGNVPAPEAREDNGIVVRRWRVDQSPAAPTEPASAPVTEFLPSVRVGWGVTLDGQLARLRDVATDELPHDPRLVRVAEHVVTNVPPTDPLERARRLYRWVVANLEEGRESDGRRAVTGKSGGRASAYLYLTRCLGLPVEIAAVRDRLTPPDEGPLASALSFNDLVIRLGRGPGCRGACEPLYFTVGDKFAPFGYLPAELRGQLAYRLVDGLPKDVTGGGGSLDGIVYDGSGELRADGSAVLDIDERFVGKLATGVRGQLEQMPEAQLKTVIETRLLARALPGARLVSLTLADKDDLDKPLTFKMHVEVSDFARRRGDRLAFKPPFMMQLGGLASLDTRQTPMLLAESTHTEVHLSIALPPGARVEAPPAGEVRDKDRVLRVSDRVEGARLVIDRWLDIPAGRVAVLDYPRFRAFATEVDELSARPYLIATP